MVKKYHFICEKCKHEYIHNNDPVSKCPKSNCGHLNKNDGQI